jgi:hypothetical protein
MPRVGARIRVTRTYATGTITAVEGIIAAFDLDKFERVTCVYFIDGFVVAMLPGNANSTVTWIELEPPKSALLPEPDDGTIWLRPGTEDRIDQVFLRADRGGAGWGARDRWFGTASRQQSWEKLDIREGDELIRLVPVPDLAELVAALRKLVVLLHNDHLHDEEFEQCEEHHCGLRAPLARYETGAAQ